MILISVLCYFDVELSVRVLGVALIGEIVILTIFDLLVLGQGGKTGIQADSLNMFKLTSPGVGLAAGVGVFLAFWSWVGFEAIPNYAEESRNPRRIVPMATLISVVALGVGYVITSVAFVSSFAPSHLIKAGLAQSMGRPGGMVTGLSIDVDEQGGTVAASAEGRRADQSASGLEC